MPAVFIWVKHWLGPTRFTLAVITIVTTMAMVAGLFLIGMLAMTEDKATDCVPEGQGYELAVSTRLERAGEAVGKMSDGKDDAEDATLFITGISDTLTFWGQSFAAGLFKDEKSRKAVEKYRQEHAKKVPADPTPAPPVAPQRPNQDVSGNPKAKGEKAVWSEMLRQGFSEIHTAGAMGNMQVESGFYPQRVQGPGIRLSSDPASTRNGYGLVQWTPGRKLKDYIGGATPTVANEIATLKKQLAGKGPHPEGAAGRTFYATDDVESAARVFHLRYERSASRDSTERIRNAKAIYERNRNTARMEPVARLVPEPTTPQPEACQPVKAAAPAEKPVEVSLVDNPSGRTTMDGKTVSRIVAAQIRLVEKKSGDDYRVMQGGFGGSHYAASGTSHNYSGVVDLACSGETDCKQKEKETRQAGFAAWARNVPGRAYVGSGDHIHAVSILDPGNKRHAQLTGSWARGENGLNGGKDPAPHYDWYPELTRLSGKPTGAPA